jgi:OmpA-OmpF porin, OOP family
MKKSIILFSAIALMISTNLFAQRTSDIEGSKDYPLVSRYKGAIIEYYKEFKWDSYKIPVSKVDQFSDVHFPKTVDVEGKIIRIQYSTSPENTPILIFKNYKDAFQKAGYNILFEGKNDEELGNNPHEFCWYFYGDDGLNLKRFGAAFNPAGTKHSYIVAEAKNINKNIYIVVYISNFSDATIITQDVIEEEAPEIGLVTAEYIDKGISSVGHSALPGVFFETGQSTIKSESGEALKNIAAFLNNHPDKKYFIVGHTDNVGDFQNNMALSESRAKAVASDLIAKFGVNASQLKAYGVANLSPVYSNSTIEGKARNRRVEIVEQ